MKTISRYIMTLALLLTAVTGAWAEEKSETIPTTASQEVYTGEHFKITTSNKQDGGLQVADLRHYDDGQLFFFIETLDGQNISKLDLQISFISDTSIDNLSLSSGTKSYDSNTKVLTITNVNAATVQISLTEGDQLGVVAISSVTYYYEESPAGPTVAWNASTKTGTFAMPGSDVVLTPIYAKAAAFATEGTEPDVKTLLPEAAEGVIAGTDASLIAEGTGIVAFAGTSTEVKQGTLMYAIGTSATEAPDLTAFSATVPTAKDIADDGADVYVWYYIKGADAPDGQQATEENTFNDSEPACLTVTVLTNKFDIQFNAANANTIEAGKATVTVDGTAATVTDGKLQGVKMGTEVKITAKEGYKFRKVEVKKKAEAKPLANATAEDLGKVVCAAGHLHDAKTAVPRSCTAVGILGKVTTTGHGLILALSDATSQAWNTIDGWTSVTTYASTTLKQLPDDTARGSNLTSYSTLGSTTVSNWCVAQKSDYEAIFTNLGSTTGDSDGMTYDGNVNAYITGVGGTAITDVYWSATFFQGYMSWSFDYISWGNHNKPESLLVRPVLAF